jgi:3-oxoacyl-[acyl-carrier-protein] synthase-1
LTSSNPDAVICGLGGSTPIGRTAWAAAAAVRAGVAGFTSHAFMVDSEGEPMRIAECPWLVSQPRMAARLSDCLITAVREAFGAVREQVDTLGLKPKLWINLPAPRPGLSVDQIKQARALAQPILDTLFPSVQVIQLGHAGGIYAIDAALRALAADRHAACVVCGVDSYLAPDTLEWLELTDQLHGAGPRNNAWGFIPGEGAGALLLMASENARRARAEPLARVVSVGLGKEPNLIRTDTVCIGQGLSTAFRQAFQSLPSGQRVTDTYCDLNGDNYRADEYGFSVLRTREHFVSASEFVTPADCWGDVGAASAPLGIVLACAAMKKSYANGPLGLVWASSEAGERGAVLLQGGARS